MKAIEKATLGKVLTVPETLISALVNAGAYMQIQAAEVDNGPLELLTSLWRLAPDVFGRTMDNNKGETKRYSSNGYLYGIPKSMLVTLEQFTRSRRHRLQPDGTYRVAALPLCLGILFQCRTFNVKPISSGISKRRERLQKFQVSLRETLPFDDIIRTDFAMAKHGYKVVPSFEREFPAGKK